MLHCLLLFGVLSSVSAGTLETSSDGKCTIIGQNVAITTPDIQFLPSHFSVDTCCDLCADYPGCGAFTLNASGCALKGVSEHPPVRVASGMTSGINPNPKPANLGFVVSGTTDAEYSGTYEWTSYVCDQKPVYQLGNSTGPVLFRNYNEWGGWWVGPSSRITQPNLTCGCSFGVEVLWTPSGECKESPDGSDCTGQWGGPEGGPDVKVEVAKPI
jgi:hypothetical protein